MKRFIALLFLILVLSSCMSDSKFIEEIDFSDGDYALYIRHKTFGEFIVTDEKAIKNNLNDLKVKFSFINYLPGEGDRGYGAILFKNNAPVKRKIGGAFTHFEIGTLADYALPVKQHLVSGIKKEVQEILDSIKNRKNSFITHQSTFVADNRAFSFRVYFPSIAIPVSREIDSTGYESIQTVNGHEISHWQMNEEAVFDKKWAGQLEDCIRKKAGAISDFEVSIAKRSTGDANIFDTAKNSGDLKTPDHKLLFIKDYMYYDFTASILANKENAEQLLILDFSDCMSEEERNKPQIIAKMKALIKQSTKPNLSLDKGEIGLDGYKDKVTKGKNLYEQEYSLNWLEIEK